MDFSSIVAAVDFGQLSFALTAVAALSMGVLVFGYGVKCILSQVKD